MTVFLIGLILVVFPFFFAAYGKVFGFWRVFLGVLAFDIVSALAMQSFHIFTYPLAVSIYACADAVFALTVLWIILRKKKLRANDQSFNKSSLKNFIAGSSGQKLLRKLGVAAAFLIIFFELFSIHFYYTGTIQTINGPGFVSGSSYSYPIFSDEWSAAALANYSIESHSLPIENPLVPGASFPNILTPFDALLAELFLVLGLSPVSQFGIFAVAAGVLLCAAIYFSMRSAGIARMPSLMATLCLPFIVNGANLPGIWFLLPYIASAIPFFIMLGYLGKKEHQERREYWPAIAAAFLSLILYPPMAVFILPAFVGAFFADRKSWNVFVEKLRAKRLKGKTKPAKIIFVSAVLVLLLVILTFVLALLKSPSLFNAVKSGFFHANLDAGIPSYAIWYILPIWLLLLAVAGFWYSWKRKQWHVLAPTTIGLLYWIFYAYYPNVIVIEYPRIVMMSAFLLVILAGAGIDYVLTTLYKVRPFFATNKGEAFLFLVLLFSFAIAAVSYPTGDSWKKLVLNVSDPSGNYFVEPAPPINRYLMPDDLSLWQGNGISDAHFVAIPWKGLVVGVSTGNYPLESKSSYVDADVLPYADFMAADCDEKAAMVSNYSISYAYSTPFECPDWLQIGLSSEGLRLYRYSGPVL